MVINKNQKIVLIVVLCFFALTLLFVPNTTIYEDGSGGTVSYTFVFEEGALLNRTYLGSRNIVLFNLIGVEWLGLLVVGGCGFLLASRSKES